MTARMSYIHTYTCVYEVVHVHCQLLYAKCPVSLNRIMASARMIDIRISHTLSNYVIIMTMVRIHESTYACIHICVPACTYVHAFVYINVLIHAYLYVQVSICTNVHMCICANVQCVCTWAVVQLTFGHITLLMMCHVS